ncbi:MAG TPA: DNA polymerase [Intrasporangium sp.]|uniref:DNA polymerase n=1 Tax=Intrasporangium sp. TaxID=1925024 RepID=UPI002D76EC0F|nr:DNA polymerase [Intrasporangium sp.]HET7399048.1 DNA polymerase [Intrasporangium sp.]
MRDSAAGAPLVALVVGSERAYAVGPGVDAACDRAAVPRLVVDVSGPQQPRWVVWSSRLGLLDVVAARVPVDRAWDLAEVHRLLHGGWHATPGHVWAACHGLPLDAVPAPHRPRLVGFDADLFDTAPDTGDDLFRADGQLRADALTSWPTTDARLRLLAQLALRCQAAQAAQAAALAGQGGAGAAHDGAGAAHGGVGAAHGGAGADRVLRTAWSESAAAVLSLELERDGLPLDRLAAEDLIGAAAGPRPRDEADADRIRAERDRAVLRHAPGREGTDLRNPGAVRDLLASVGVSVPNTRAWVLEPYRHTHPLVDALLTWRKDERIGTTYGYRWLDEHVGSDDRLRGAWSSCDGGAGRMTAQHGLHNLPAPLRPAVCAERGHVLVQADLGQVEPRVLAVVSGDRAFAEATRSDDLYAPVAAKLGIDRPRAKVAVLAAMYGQRSGAAGEALRDLERAYPVAMRLLDRAYAAGIARAPVRTHGGRLIPLGGASPPGEGSGVDGSSGPGDGEVQPATAGAGAADAARGRYARNAIIQGSAAELFKAWAATVRWAVRPLGGQIVLCLHDELLVHVPEPRAVEAARAVEQALTVAARTWAGTDQVRFVADTSVVRRWSEAKG